MNLRQLLPAVPFLLAAACATPVAIERPEHTLQAELREFQHAQMVFRSQNTGIIGFDFEGHGRVTVREVSLDGFPGKSYVRCRFHYQNRTAQPVSQAWVSLDVLDGNGMVVSTQAAHCLLPIAMPFERGTYYSDELRTPTYGAHLQPGWSWRVRCTADLELGDEPLAPPAPERTIRQSPPMIIKDRGWLFPSYGTGEGAAR